MKFTIQPKSDFSIPEKYNFVNPLGNVKGNLLELACLLNDSCAIENERWNILFGVTDVFWDRKNQSIQLLFMWRFYQNRFQVCTAHKVYGHLYLHNNVVSVTRSREFNLSLAFGYRKTIFNIEVDGSKTTYPTNINYKLKRWFINPVFYPKSHNIPMVIELTKKKG